MFKILAIRELQMVSTMYIKTLIRIAKKSLKVITPNTDKDVENLGYHALLWEYKMVYPFWKRV